MNTRLQAIIATIVIALLIGVCSIGNPMDNREASTQTLIEVLDSRAGSMFGYSTLDDQVLDSDAVVVGRIIGVESAGSETIDGSNTLTVEYMNVLIKVTEVVHTASDTAIKIGDTIKIVTFLPGTMTISEANKAIPSDNLSVHFLFSSTSLRQRRDQAIGSAENSWIYQTNDSVIIRDELNQAVSVDTMHSEMNPRTFDSFLQQVRMSASAIVGVPRPIAPIGLNHTLTNELQPHTGTIPIPGITEPANEPPTPDAQQTGESTAGRSMAGFAAYDESIPETSMSASYWVTHDDLNSLTRSSDIAFVGRITDYTEAVLVVPDDPAEEPDPTVDVYDGVVFTVDELLVGELPAGETQVTIATRVLLRNKDGTPRFRVSASPIEIVRPGIFARNEPDRQRYIVYALAGHKGTPFYATGTYFFNTPGGVAPVLANDRIGIGAARPLAGALEEAGIEGAIATEGEGTGTPTVGPGSEPADSGLELDDARTAARTATLAVALNDG